MTKKETAEKIRRMKAFGDEVASSKKRAVDTLKAAGIMNDNGEVKRQFKKALRIAS